MKTSSCSYWCSHDGKNRLSEMAKVGRRESGTSGAATKPFRNLIVNSPPRRRHDQDYYSRSTSEPTRDRGRAIGAILVDQGRLSAGEVEQIQQFAGENGVRFGDAAMQLQMLTQNDIDLAIAQQFNYPILPRGGEGGVADDVVAAYLPQSEMVEPLRVLRSQLSLRWVSDPDRKF